MLNLEEFENLRENNRLEVKKATLVIPNSIWETYSAFCNTYGGTILLGVDEDKNSHLCTCGLTKKRAYSIVNDVWNTLNNPTKISVNVLSNEDIQVQKVGDDYIVVINVPQANSMYKPVFINNNPLYAYRRNHDGDYRCTMDEIKSLLRDNEDYSDDKNIIPDMDLSVINKDTLTAYKNAYKQYHNDNHPFANEDDPEFLIHIGAARKDSQGVVRPTKAGLLMFGNYYDITNVYHNYFLDYQDHRNLEDDETRWSLRITASYGDWSGNLYDFFNRIVYRLTEDIAVPFKMKGIYRDDSSIMKKAIREALCNTLSNADYHGGLSVVVTQYHDKIVFSNPGSLVLPLEQIYIGGQSKARNKTILNMFSFVNIGERAGSGFPLILKATKESNFPSPIIYDQFNPDCTILTIFITKVDSKVQNPNGSV